ncbi:GyrI-like domain-containing protein [Chitinophaga caseinilytica]|uniref:GyrI-like domain-containing protein n=1 Tax=Chitinophaga caseinilytica TaxID=2267521 RepID=UPI003C2E1A85
MQKTDLNKELRQYYRARSTPELVTIAPGQFLTVEGTGDCQAGEFRSKIKTLLATAGNVRKISKLQGNDFRMPALESYWWAKSDEPFPNVTATEWNWKLAIQMPAFVSRGDCRQAAALAGNKKLPFLDALRFEAMPPALAVQLLHTGSYFEEEASVARLHQYIRQHHLEVNGVHHEIYLNDPGKTPPDKLKTILRLNVKAG